MNYYLNEILKVIESRPPPREPGTLDSFQLRLDGFDGRLLRIRGLAKELQDVLDGNLHTFVVGSTVGLPAGTCGACGKGLRSKLHDLTEAPE